MTLVFNISLGNSTLARMLTESLCISSLMGADVDPVEKLYVVGKHISEET